MDSEDISLLPSLDHTTATLLFYASAHKQTYLLLKEESGESHLLHTSFTQYMDMPVKMTGVRIRQVDNKNHEDIFHLLPRLYQQYFSSAVLLSISSVEGDYWLLAQRIAVFLSVSSEDISRYCPGCES